MSIQNNERADPLKHIAAAIAASNMAEDIGSEHVGCGSAGCPIDFNDTKAAA